MGSLSKPRRRSLPQLDDERRAILTSVFLKLYAADEQFQTKLRSLIDKHSAILSCFGDAHETHGRCPGWFVLEAKSRYGDNEPIKLFVSAIQSLVTKWGLDRLPDEIGYEAVTRELVRLHRYPDSKVMLLHVGMHFIPHVEGEDVSVDEWPRPLLFSFGGSWNPARETPGKAIERLEREFAAFISEEILDGIQRLEAAGYDYDDAWMTDVYLRWLYRRVALREPVQDIALSAHTTPATVEIITKKHARILGIARIPDNRYSRRGKR